jgi:hypothetical protein
MMADQFSALGWPASGHRSYSSRRSLCLARCACFTLLGVCEVAVEPGGDGCGGVFWPFAAGVDAVCDGAAQPSAEFDLFFDVAASPGRALIRVRRSSSLARALAR